MSTTKRFWTCTALALLLAGWPGRSDAVCMRGTDGCVCGPQRPDFIVQGRVTSVGEVTGLLEIDVVHGDGGDSLEPPTSPVEFDSTGFEAAGDPMLLHITGGVVTLRQHLDADGAVDCGKHGVRITQTEAIALAFGDDCAEALLEFGYQEVECNDHGGCQSTGGSSTVALLLVLALGLTRSTRRTC